jgi:two-component system, NarL family, sensor kinase
MADAAAALHERLEQLATLNAIGEILNQEAAFLVAAERALARLVELLGLQAGWLFVTRVAHGTTKEGSLALSACHGLPPALAVDDAGPLREPGCECQWRFRTGELDAGVNIVRCSRLEAAQGDTAGLEVHASIPLLGRQGPVGIMNLAAPGRSRFDDATLAFLTAVGRQLGTAFDRSRLLEDRTREAGYAAALEERQRLAVEMHDSVAQLLFAAELALQGALGEPAAGREPLATAAGRESLATAAGLVGEALQRLQALIEVLRPADPAAPLATLLLRLAERVGTATEVSVEVEAVELEPAATLALYRVAQEATHNVLRHARATHVWLRLRNAPKGVTLAVLDDGVGLPDELAHAGSGGMGLAGMRRRMREVGGRLVLSERPGGGTRVEATVPWRG